MSATTSTRSAIEGRLPLAAVTGIALATVFTALGTFRNPDDHAWRQMLVVFAIILATAALAFWFARRSIASGDVASMARTSVVLGALAVVSLLVFWAGPPAVLAAASTLVAVATKDRRAGAWGRGPATAVALSTIAVVLAAVAAMIG